MTQAKLVRLDAIAKKAGVHHNTLRLWAKGMRLKDLPRKGRGRPAKAVSAADAAKLLAKARAFTRARDGQ